MTDIPVPQIIRAAIAIEPRVLPYLSEEARRLLKTVEYFQATMERLIQSVYDGNLGGEFIGIVEDLVLGQISQAYEQAWQDDGNPLPVPEYLRDASQAMVLEQQSHVENLYRDIIDARVDKTPVEPLLSRAALWSNQYNSAYNDAVLKIAAENGARLQWIYGDTDHCPECEALNGIVAYAREWDELNVHPQQPPNDLITCGGWRCQCALVPTDQRRSPKAFDTIMNIVGK
jgi:hypothetical protein